MRPALIATTMLLAACAPRATMPQPGTARPFARWVGAWSCQVATAADVGRAAERFPATLSFDYAPLGGAWLVGHYEESRRKHEAAPMIATDYWTVDRGAGNLVRMWIDSTGAWAQMTGKRPDEQSIVWSTAEFMGRPIALRQSLTVQADHLKIETAAASDGGWTTVDTADCRRRSR